ncbi:hypothetical protein VP01_2336g1 [Puccinia sorghi]|uniref:Uncharacterized protein n=1 Tax=Puccinia sorghi TaxID=27349 RepID=A0A0L6V9B5_9BASI|nr:hypothetical protein VP01_2336g1 [Puccinia sorghi]
MFHNILKASKDSVVDAPVPCNSWYRALLSEFLQLPQNKHKPTSLSISIEIKSFFECDFTMPESLFEADLLAKFGFPFTQIKDLLWFSICLTMPKANFRVEKINAASLQSFGPLVAHCCSYYDSIVTCTRQSLKEEEVIILQEEEFISLQEEGGIIMYEARMHTLSARGVECSIPSKNQLKPNFSATLTHTTLKQPSSHKLIILGYNFFYLRNFVFLSLLKEIQSLSHWRFYGCKEGILIIRVGRKEVWEERTRHPNTGWKIVLLSLNLLIYGADTFFVLAASFIQVEPDLGKLACIFSVFLPYPCYIHPYLHPSYLHISQENIKKFEHFFLKKFNLYRYFLLHIATKIEKNDVTSWTVKNYVFLICISTFHPQT